MIKKKRKHKRNPLSSSADEAYGKKMKKLDSQQGKFNKKRMKAWTTLTPVGKKTKWTY